MPSIISGNYLYSVTINEIKNFVDKKKCFSYDLSSQKSKKNNNKSSEMIIFFEFGYCFNIIFVRY